MEQNRAQSTTDSNDQGALETSVNHSSSPTGRRASASDHRLHSDPSNLTSSSDEQSSNGVELFLYYLDLPLNLRGGSFVGYVDFAAPLPTHSTASIAQTNQPQKRRRRENRVQEILEKAITESETNANGDDDDEKKTLTVAKKLLFPNPVAPSFAEAAEILRNERRQEFCPIYEEKTAEELAKRSLKRKPIGSLLAKRIRWDDLKRQRQEEEQRQRQAQQSFPYGSYGPGYPNQPSSSYGSSYEHNYPSNDYRYDQMAEIARVQQEHSGFWPELQQQQQQSLQTHYPNPYPPSYSNTSSGMNYDTALDYSQWYYSNAMQMPPPPPPSEPYPY